MTEALRWTLVVLGSLAVYFGLMVALGKLMKRVSSRYPEVRRDD